MWNILVNIVNQALLSDGVTNEPLNHLFDFLYNRSCNFMFVRINLKVILSCVFYLDCMKNYFYMLNY